MKITLLALLVILTFSETLVVGPNNSSNTTDVPPQSPPRPSSIQYTSLPLNKLDTVYLFLL